MRFADVESILNAQPEPLAHPQLAVLQASDTLYKTLLLQPEGRIRVTEDGIGHADPDRAVEQLRAFLATAAQPGLQPDLLICPEYSVPWQVVTESIEGDVVPEPGKLWVLGCESLALGELPRLRERLRGKVLIIDDESSPVPLTTQRYRNPLVYIFQARTRVEGDWRLVMLVQYKTQPSGDPSNTEARGMLPGNSVYRFGRPLGEVRLVTLICSDVFGFSDEQIAEHHDGLLLIHIQLNNNPRHAVYKPYRQELFSYQGKTELICLNWAENITVCDERGELAQEWKNIGGSAWYLVSSATDISDARVAENHAHGLYYTRYESVRVHAIQFHYGPQAFLIESTKVFHHAVVGPRSHLSGPRALETLQWVDEERSWTPASALGNRPDDGFSELLGRAAAGVSLQDIQDVYATGPVPAERVLALTAGEFGPKEDWHTPLHIDSMRLCSEEIVRRITYTLDPQGDSFRSNRLSAARTVIVLRNAGYAWPVEVGFLRGGFRLRWSQRFPHRNVEALDGTGTLATVIFAGVLGDTLQLDRIDRKARKTLAGPVPEPLRELNEDEWRQHERNHYARPLRLCVLYNDGVSVAVYRSPASSSITTPAGPSAIDFTAPAPRLQGDREAPTP